MLVYLCDLWNEGEKEPLETFLAQLGVPLGEHRKLRAAREHKKIDLVVLDAENDSPIIGIEMKVDSHEGGGEGVRQTIVHKDRLLPRTPYLYVTLGVGEYYRAPYSEQAQWVRIREFYGALKAITDSNTLIDSWREAIGKEIALQDKCFCDDQSRIEEYRNRNWNLYLLGHLKESLVESLQGGNSNIDPAVYTAGPAPDTILNFGWSKHPVYVEINDNSLLNLKINIKEQPSRKEKEEHIEKARDHYQERLKEFDPTQNTRRPGHNANSHTIMRFDVGLQRKYGNISYKLTKAEAVGKLSKVLDKFFTEPPALPFRPRSH